MSVVVAIDPGRDKCGVAVVSDEGVLHARITPPDSLADLIPGLITTYSADTLIIGNGTHSRPLAEILRTRIGVPIEFADESYTTLKARARFFEENPPRGLLRLIPRGMLTPSRPVDDLAAVILAEEYLSARATADR